MELIYLHGLGGNPEPARAYLEAMADRLAIPRESVQAPDLRRFPGFEGSGGTLEGVVEWILEELEDRGPFDSGTNGSSLVVGHSVGALLGVLLESRLRSVVGGIYLEPAFASAVVAPFERYAGEPTDGSGRRQLLRELEAIEAPSERERAYRESVRRTEGRLFDVLAREMVERRRALADRAGTSELSHLYVAGREAVGEELRETGESAVGGRVDVEIFEGLGHNPHYEAPERIAECCVSWIYRRLSAAGLP